MSAQMKSYDEVAAELEAAGRLDANGYPRLRFRRFGNDTGEWVCHITDAHVLTRTLAWGRLGGWRYDFRCTCGWGSDNPYAGRRNTEGQRHALHVLRTE